MDNCIVCCKSNEDIFSRITTVSSEWKEWNIQRIIEKHLWWWYLRPPPSSSLSNGTVEQWICRQCWQELSTFHSFYNRVEKEHRLYDTFLISHINTDPEKENVAFFDIKVEEEQNFEDASSILKENLIVLEKSKRGRKKRTAERIQIEELNIIEVKDENDIAIAAEPALLDDSMTDDDNRYEEELTDNDQDDPVKAKAVTKSRKKYKKSNMEKKIVIVKNDTNSRTKYDEFLADHHFEMSCSICHDILDSFGNLKIHFREKHNTLAYAMCCNKKFYRRSYLVDHLNLHKDPNYFKCPKCDKTVTTRYSYTQHMATHRLYETQQNLFKCDKCEKSFLKKSVFERHVALHVPEEERQFQCSMCDKKFATAYLLKQHTTYKHVKKYAKICDICGVSLPDKLSFNRHMAVHNGEKPLKYKCDICEAELTNKYFLNRHKKLLHTLQQEQICPHCSKISPNYVAHKNHVRYAHALERKHACHLCEKRFRRPQELKEHLSTHTGEPLYTCAYCPHTFISNANMYKHLRLKHEKEWQERRMKREAKTFACKEFLKSAATEESESCYEKIPIMELESSEAVQNLLSEELNF